MAISEGTIFPRVPASEAAEASPLLCVSILAGHSAEEKEAMWDVHVRGAGGDMAAGEGGLAGRICVRREIVGGAWLPKLSSARQGEYFHGGWVGEGACASVDSCDG